MYEGRKTYRMLHFIYMKRKSFFDRIGPGFITGASDNDPSGIITYTQVGARFGLDQLWTALWCLPFLAVMQEMVGRIGLVTGEGLVASLRKHYSKPIMWMFVGLLFFANTLNIGADLGAMAEATRLLFPQVPFSFLVIGFSLCILLLEIFITYKKYANILKWFALSLFGYVVTAFLVTTDWRALISHAAIPTMRIDKEFMMGIVAIFGTTISPYLFIWQPAEQVEEEISQGKLTITSRRGATKKEMSNMQKDISWGMGFSQFITFCIIATAAFVFFVNGFYGIDSASEAANTLRPIAGDLSYLLYAVGIIGTGLLAIPILSASASYAFADASGMENGLYKKFRDAHGFYGVIILSTVLGLLINFLHLNSISVLYWTAVINGLVMPPLIGIILVIANNSTIMGTWKNGKITNTIGILTFLLMTCAGVMFLAL